MLEKTYIGRKLEMIKSECGKSVPIMP
jgi:hypothetical protein